MKHFQQKSGVISLKKFWSSTVALFTGLTLVATTSIAYGQKTTVEAENMSPTGSQPIKWDTDGAASHGKYVDFVTAPTAPGAYIEFTIPGTLLPGMYALTVYFKTKENRGMWQASIDGVNVGPVVDEWENTTIGTLGKASPAFNVSLSSAGKKIRLTVVNKNPLNTTGLYTMTVDWFEFAPVSSNPGMVKDIDGNVYRTVILGSQEWTITNLKTTRLNDGTPIPNVTVPLTDWIGLITPAYCWYDNDIANKDKYGALYNWYAASAEKLAPVGWRVPMEQDWIKLENFLIANGFNWDGTTTSNKLGKSVAASIWENSAVPGAVGNNNVTNNKSCFSGFPAGNRSNDDGKFYSLTEGCNWWVTTPEIDIDRALAYHLTYSSEALTKDDESKKFGFSIRLVRDLP